MYFMYVSWLDRNSYCRHITARCSFYTCGYYSMSWVDPSSLAKLTWIHFAQHAFAHCNLLLCWGSSVHSNRIYSARIFVHMKMFKNPSHIYNCEISCVFKNSQRLLKVYIMHIWVPFCMNCFISWFCSRPDFCKMHEICFTENFVSPF